MRATAAVFLLLVLGTAAYSAQGSAQPQAVAPTFEVASVKPSPPDSTGSLISGPAPSGFTTRNAPLDRIIQYAYAIRDCQLVDVPSWTRSERFDIVAKYPAGGPAGQVPLMVRALLVDRFKLRVHTEMREGPTYALMLAGGDRRLGPKLRQSESDCPALMAELKKSGRTMAFGPNDRPICIGLVSDRFIRGGGRTIAMLASSLSARVGRPVVDRTGLTGDFDYDLEWSLDLKAVAAPDPLAGAATLDDNLSIFTALQEQLGLKLHAEREPVEALVIDSVERPTPD